MKLELGSGDRPTPGFVHLDVRWEAPDVDLVGDATMIWGAIAHDRYTGPAPARGGCEEIRAAHLLEHFSHRLTVSVLRDWRDFLMPGGRLTIEVPNLTGHIDAWLRGDSTDGQLVTYLFGEQDHEFNFHRTMFTDRTLRESLQAAGLIVTGITDLGLVLCAEAIR